MCRKRGKWWYLKRSKKILHLSKNKTSEVWPCSECFYLTPPFFSFSLSHSLSSANKGERAPPHAPGGVAAPSHLPKCPGADVGEANASGGPTPCSVLLLASQQTCQPGRTVAPKSPPNRFSSCSEVCWPIDCVVCLNLFDKTLLFVWQVEEAQRKHDLLVEIVHKEQEHKRRLVSITTDSNNIPSPPVRYATQTVNARMCMSVSVFSPTKLGRLNPKCSLSRRTSESASSSRSQPRTDWRNKGSRSHAPRSTTTTTTSSTAPAWWGPGPERRGWVLTITPQFTEDNSSCERLRTEQRVITG